MTEEQAEYLPEIVDTSGSLIQYVISQNASVEALEKIMALQERSEAMVAKKAYTRAMAAFKSNPPEIIKNKTVSFSTQKGKTEYSHATLDHVADAIGKAMAKYGLSASWKIEQNGKIKVTCIITHEMGHSESTSIQADAETSGTKNPIQAIGSAITYLQRYTLLSLTGLASKDQDDDGASTMSYVTEEQAQIIAEALVEKAVDDSAFLKYMNAESIEMIFAKDFNKAMSALKKAKGRK